MIDTKLIRKTLYGMEWSDEPDGAYKRLFSAFVDLLEQIDEQQVPHGVLDHNGDLVDPKGQDALARVPISRFPLPRGLRAKWRPANG